MNYVNINPSEFVYQEFRGDEIQRALENMLANLVNVQRFGEDVEAGPWVQLSSSVRVAFSDAGVVRIDTRSRHGGCTSWAPLDPNAFYTLGSTIAYSVREVALQSPPAPLQPRCIELR